MNATPLRHLRRLRLHGLCSLFLALTLLPSTVAPSATARAEEPVIRDHRDPIARVLLVIKKVIVHNDMDVGDGEIGLTIRVHTLEGNCLEDLNKECGPVLVRAGLPVFTAPAGTVKQFDRTVPAYGDTINAATISPPFGIPIPPSGQVGFTIDGTEWDPRYDDDLGRLRASFTDESGQVRLGTHSERASGGCVDNPPPGSDFCPPDVEGQPGGGFEVEYEIRQATLPDLRPVGIEIYELPGSTKSLVCAAIQNVEAGDAGPFELEIQVDGAVPPDGRTRAGQLLSGNAGELCLEMTLPATGQHQLTAVVDGPDAVLEYNERNNVYAEPYVAARTVPEGGAPTVPTTEQSADPILVTMPAPSPAPATATPVSAAPEPAASRGTADLTVGAVKVNGQAPDGKDDCKDDKNAVTVAVKNGGKGNASAFTVRLLVDGDEAGEQPVSGLEAGQQREVRFGDVRLKKGKHTLAIAVDPKGDVAESDEENNERVVTATCKADD